MTATPPLLDVRGLHKGFTIHHLGRGVPAFAPVSFAMRAGMFLRVDGPNGAGKSSLLRCLYRTYLPDGGQALYQTTGGHSIDLALAADADMLALRRAELGMVTQFLRPRPRVSALALVAEPLVQAGAHAPDAHAHAEDLLDAFGLKRALWQAYPSTFSGGEQQKVNLARALAAPRRLILLDEPTASLDVGARRALADRLAALKADGVALLGVFHTPGDVADLVDAVVTLAPATYEDFDDTPEATPHVAD